MPATARLLWEFEEEIGSPNLEPLVRRQARHLTGHSVVVSDSSWLNRSHPSSIVGLRGFVGFRFLLETAEVEAHAGDVGGAARNPLGELMQLATGLHDARTGRVRVPGFYDDVPPLSAAERRDFLRSGFSLAAYRRDNRLRGRETAFVRDGGTIGAVVIMRRVLGWPMAFLNLSLPEHGYHAPNENFDWPQAEGGMAAFARYLEEVSRAGPVSPRARRSPGRSAA